MIGLLYMMARDQEMPPAIYWHLIRHGVPRFPLLIAVGLPVIVIITTSEFHRACRSLCHRCRRRDYCQSRLLFFNRVLPMKLHDRVLFGITFVILFLVEITLAHTKPDALFFVCCVLGVGLALRAYTLKKLGLTTLMYRGRWRKWFRPTLAASMQPRLEEGQAIMVAARGITPVLSYALDEAQLRKASLYVVFVKEIAVYYGAGPVRRPRAMAG